MTLEELFDTKLTENGDVAFNSLSDNDLINILFLTEYYQKHLNEVPNIGTSALAKTFAMFIRDPRYGLGCRDLGRKLMFDASCTFEDILKAGRADDLFFANAKKADIYDYLKWQICQNNELVKKWMPRYSSKQLQLAREIAKYWKMNKQQYGHFIKCNTTENKLSRHDYNGIDFEHVPSLAMIKYAHAFSNKPELASRYQQYLIDVKEGKKDLKVSTTTVYDIFKNAHNIDADLFFSKIEKISGSWIPIVDTSGSMWDSNDSIGKALSIGHYLAKCSTYCPNKVISFSSHPQLITLGIPAETEWHRNCLSGESVYAKEINSMYTGDCSNTDFGAVMGLLSNLDGDMPDYLIVLSDMEFDKGSYRNKNATMRLFHSKGYKTRIIWWNFNSRNITCPEKDIYGNIYLSGYNPLLLKYLQAGFDSEQFLLTLLREYVTILSK